jgi:hypothetical protein
MVAMKTSLSRDVKVSKQVQRCHREDKEFVGKGQAWAHLKRDMVLVIKVVSYCFVAE